MAKSSPFSETKSDDLAISTFDIFEMKMSNVMIVKLSLLVFKKGDDLTIVTFEKVTIAESSQLFPQTLPQSQTQTQAKKTHESILCGVFRLIEQEMETHPGPKEQLTILSLKIGNKCEKRDFYFCSNFCHARQDEKLEMKS